ncbi:hypothetical protein KFL_001490085 [Klebsormidium nitens]|uniref:ABC transporter domain-containing protein n=1 Tax=Klebsormidium nitens TaxID=105231 RepID=A0A1Y1I5S9_KLENI|nr:hypothetical protein KFL_001490085 [Klebsormidium nitens]|eukprot:GAQ83468.1 hypothetical protein KFL_001490085 [Klebsormidium nitens]
MLVSLPNVQQGTLLVRWLSSFAPALETAAALQGIFIVIFVAFAGFLVPRNKIPDWWIWAYWMDPLQWGISIIMINEMRSATYKQPCASFTPQYLLAHTLTGPCRQAPDRELGFAYLVQWQLKTSWYWVPIGVVVYLTWCALWLGLSYVALSEIRHVVVPKVRPLAARKGSAAPEVKAGNPEKETATTHDAEKGANIKPCMTSLHFLPVTLSWHDLSHSVVIPGVGESKNVLSYVSGWAKPGRLLALMSSGGAAKSLLLRVLAGKMVPGRTTGQILVNGYPRNPATFRRYCTMVERVESHSPFMTVREAIQFSARLRLPGTTTESQREAFIDQILDVMELRPFKNVLVGSLGKAGVTLANAHKLTVAVELAANPSTLLMDDPLSGLDSRSAVHVLHCIKNAAVDCGRTVVCTVTQPGARCLGVFDDLLLLNAAGETCYFGELGYRGQKLISYFEGIPGTPRIDRDVNPATYALGVTGAGIDPSRTGGNHTFRDYAFEYRVSDLAFSQVGEIESLRRGKGKLGDEPSLMGPAAPYARQFWEIVLRMQRYHYRNLHYSWARVMSSVILGLILGSIFLNISYHTTPGMQARGGFVFIILVINAVGNAQNAAGQVLSQRPVHRREVGNGMYTFAFANVAWALAEVSGVEKGEDIETGFGNGIYNFRSIANVPYLAISTLVFCSIACTMANIVTGSFGTFLQFWFTLYMFCLAVTYFGMLVAAVSPTPVHSSVIVTCITSMWIATAGLVLPRVLIPDVYIWVYWTNPFQYALQGMTSVAFFCDTTTAACSAPGCATRSCPGCDCTRLSDNPSFVWTALKSQRNLHEGQAKWDIFYLFLFCVAFRLLTWVALKTLKHNRA